MNIVCYTVQFLQVRTEEVWQKFCKSWGIVGVWSLIVGGIMKSCCGRLSQMFINFSISHSMWVLCSLWNTMKSCVSLCNHLKQEQYYYWKGVVILYIGTFEMAFMEVIVGYMYNLENFSGRD